MLAGLLVDSNTRRGLRCISEDERQSLRFAFVGPAAVLRFFACGGFGRSVDVELPESRPRFLHTVGGVCCTVAGVEATVRWAELVFLFGP